MQHITGIARNQMVFSSLEDSISKDNSVRFIEAFVENIDLKALGFGSLWDFDQFLETWETSKFAIGIESANSADKTENFAQKMSVLQGRKFGKHRSFWIARAAARLSFHHPNFVCKIILWVREIVFRSEEKPQKKPKTGD